MREKYVQITNEEEFIEVRNKFISMGYKTISSFNNPNTFENLRIELNNSDTKRVMYIYTTNQNRLIGVNTNSEQTIKGHIGGLLDWIPAAEFLGINSESLLDKLDKLEEQFKK